MAKGNMLISMARGKVGDLVFSRLDGEQVIRTRNRHPKNPKTEAQLYQRAIMATVLRAYSAGKVIFDHAFEDKQVGAQCQRYFLSENAKRLRAAIAADLEEGDSSGVADGHVVAPGVNTPVPFTYLVSQGSLSASPLSVSDALPPANNGEKIGEYASRIGLVNGEFHTLVAYGCPNKAMRDYIKFQVNGVTADGGVLTKGEFGFIRFVVDIKDEDKDTVITEETLMSKFLRIDESLNMSVPTFTTQTYYDLNFYMKYEFSGDASVKTAGVIHSIENEGKRSECILQVRDEAGEWGISSFYALQAWLQGATALGESELILEGGDL